MMALNPITREEIFMAAGARENIKTPIPITRQEQFLQELIEAVKSGGATPDVIEAAVTRYLDNNPVKPGATEEEAQQIFKNTEDIEALKAEMDSIKEWIQGGYRDDIISLLSELGVYPPTGGGGNDDEEEPDIPDVPDVPDVPPAPEGDISITYELEGCDLSNKQSSIAEGAEYNSTITAENNKHLGLVYVETGGADITKDVYNSETDKINIKAVTKDTYIEVICPDVAPTKTVDLLLFSGQSNMSGRGDGNEATACPFGEGYWYKDGALSEITGFFGNEENSTGSMVSSVAKAYYDSCGVPIVGVSSSYGGTPINGFAVGSRFHDDAVAKFNEAKAYLENNGYTIRNKAMLWCQGETDAYNGVSQTEYEQKFKAIRDDFISSCGINEFFIVEIGQYRYDEEMYDEIKAAQDNLAATEDDIIMASKKFVGAKSLMADAWHYVQAAYNLVGRDAGIHMAYYYVTGKTPRITEFSAADVNDQNVGVVEELDTSAWDYTVYENKGQIGLHKYLGTATDVTVKEKYSIDGVVYKTLIDRVKIDNSYVGLFQGNTTIETVAFEDDIAYAQGGDLSYNLADSMFQGCSALVRVDNVPPMLEGGTTSTRSVGSMYRSCSVITHAPIPANAKSWTRVYQDCKELAEPVSIPEGVGSLYYAFAGTKIAHCPDIPASVTDIKSMFYGSGKDPVLVSVGTIKPNVNSMNATFRGQSAISGKVRIESTEIADLTNAFATSAIPNITFEVPADSTTYNTFVEAYPDANITTF